MATSSKPKYVYISGPHYDSDPLSSFVKASQYAAILHQAGYCPYVPHHIFLNMVTPMEVADFEKINLDFLKLCDVLLIVQGGDFAGLPEEKLAIELGIPVYRDISDLIQAARRISL